MSKKIGLSFFLDVQNMKWNENPYRHIKIKIINFKSYKGSTFSWHGGLYEVSETWLSNKVNDVCDKVLVNA